MRLVSSSYKAWAKRRLALIKKRAARCAERVEDSKLVAAAADRIKQGKGDKKLMALASKVDPANNPPEWVADEATWERAKKAVEAGKWEEYDEPYAVVAHVYQNMGGKLKGQK